VSGEASSGVLQKEKKRIGRGMKIALKCVIALAGLLAVEVANISISRPRAELDPGNDPRLLKLESFFKSYNAPAHKIAEEFLRAADLNSLDWRLLPSVSIVESGGGREHVNNNILGWDSCRTEFPSVVAGVHHVAYRLSESKLYRHKSLDAKLKTYNPYPGYPEKVKRLMRRLGPDRGPQSTLPQSRDSSQ
jgi:hypothetical protein